MKRIRKSWIALVLGTLLIATLVGVVWARPKASPAYKLTMPAAHFHPKQDGYDWYNTGNSLYLNSGTGVFYAALPIALPGRFTVEKMTLFAGDWNGSEDICARLYRVNPWTTSAENMGHVCTTGLSGPQSRSTTTFSPDTIYGGHGAFVRLEILSSSALEVYAVQVEYH